MKKWDAIRDAQEVVKVVVDGYVLMDVPIHVLVLATGLAKDTAKGLVKEVVRTLQVMGGNGKKQCLASRYC